MADVFGGPEGSLVFLTMAAPDSVSGRAAHEEKVTPRTSVSHGQS